VYPPQRRGRFFAGVWLTAWKAARMTLVRANIVGLAPRCDNQQGFHRCLPFRLGVLGLWKPVM
jgi:hypothetical protein